MQHSAGVAPAERAALQVCVALGGLVPVLAGGASVLFGSRFIEGAELAVSADSHFHYLSGLLLAIGIAFWSTIPAIERRQARFRLLTAIVFAGGLARLWAMIRGGTPSNAMLFGLGMELGVTPLLCLWQRRVAAKASAST